MKSFVRRSVLMAVGLGASLIAAQSGAVGTRTFDLTSGKDFEGGDLAGVAVDSAGRVRAGFNLGQTPIKDATTIWSALRLKDGSVLLGTGNEGKLLSVKGGKVSEAADTKQLVVTSLAEVWGGGVAVGTLPEGKLFKYEGGKLTDLVKKLDGVEHIWSLAFDAKNGALYAGTGPQGKVFRITRAGTAQVYFDAEEQHIMSVAVAPDGTVYAGSSDKAKLYKVTGPGRASVLYDFGRDEVRGIAVAADGTVYAIANEIKTKATNRVPSSRSRGGAAQPRRKTVKTKGKGTLYKFAPDGSPEQLLDDKTEHFTALTIDDKGQPYVGTGADGKIFTVDSSLNSVLVADTDESSVTALLLEGKGQFVAASDPAVLHPVRGVGGADAVWTSKVFDAGLRAQWGRLSWLASGNIELSTRSGNTKEPDDTWSQWSPGMAAPGGIKSPAARFFQVRARWSRDPNAVLHEVKVPFVTDNLRAVVTTVGDGDGDVKDGVQESGGPITDKADPKVSLKWKVENPDKDELRYYLHYRLVGTTTWYELLPPGEKLTKESYSWDTSSLPEGKYRIRVTASDEISNPPSRVKKHQLESDVIIVDNTPPTIEGLAATGRRIRGKVVDGVGPVQRIEIGLAGRDEWIPVFPKDGIFDQQSESFEVDASSLSASGAVLISVRAYDQNNNFVVRNIALK